MFDARFLCKVKEINTNKESVFLLTATQVRKIVESGKFEIISKIDLSTYGAIK